MHRKRLPSVRASVTHKFTVANYEGYLVVGLYEDGTPGELFIRLSKEGSTLSGLLDTVGVTVSLALQYGVPLASLCKKLRHMRFEPDGRTNNSEIPMASSITDYIFTWLEKYFAEQRGQHIVAIDKDAIAE